MRYLTKGDLYKLNFRCHTVLLIKNFSLYILHILRLNFLIAPCLAYRTYLVALAT